MLSRTAPENQPDTQSALDEQLNSLLRLAFDRHLYRAYEWVLGRTAAESQSGQTELADEICALMGAAAELGLLEAQDWFLARIEANRPATQAAPRRRRRPMALAPII